MLVLVVFQLNVFSQNCLPEGITFRTQTEVDSFQINYPNCTVIEGNVDVSSGNIRNLNGLSVLTEIDGYLWLSNCDLLNDISGLHNLSSIEGGLHIAGIDRLKNLSGLEGLVSIDGIFEVVFCDSILNFFGLSSLSYIGGDVQIHSNLLLSDMSGMESLTRTNGGLFIGFNEELISLNGLQSLTSIGGDISIHENNSLVTLSGIDQVNSGSISNLEISANNSLAICEVKSVCDYLIAPSGSAIISDNDNGCNNRAEIEAACEIVSNNEVKIAELIGVAPNPGNAYITVINRSDAVITQLSLFNQLGVKLYTSEIELKQVDVSFMDKGLYILEIQLEKGCYRTKLIIN